MTHNQSQPSIVERLCHPDFFVRTGTRYDLNEAVARIQELEAALRPFAASPYASDMVKVPGTNPREIFICEGVSLADMHAARATLKEISK